jgi:hypothetical protein
MKDKECNKDFKNFSPEAQMLFVVICAEHQEIGKSALMQS